MTFVAGEIACTLEDRNAQRTHTHRRDCRPRPAAYSAGRLVVHVRDDVGSEFSARSGADPQSKSVTLGAGPAPSAELAGGQDERPQQRQETIRSELGREACAGSGSTAICRAG